MIGQGSGAGSISGFTFKCHSGVIVATESKSVEAVFVPTLTHCHMLPGTRADVEAQSSAKWWLVIHFFWSLVALYCRLTYIAFTCWNPSLCILCYIYTYWPHITNHSNSNDEKLETMIDLGMRLDLDIAHFALWLCGSQTLKNIFSPPSKQICSNAEWSECEYILGFLFMWSFLVHFGYSFKVTDKTSLCGALAAKGKANCHYLHTSE